MHSRSEVPRSRSVKPAYRAFALCQAVDFLDHLFALLNFLRVSTSAGHNLKGRRCRCPLPAACTIVLLLPWTSGSHLWEEAMEEERGSPRVEEGAGSGLQVYPPCHDSQLRWFPRSYVCATRFTNSASKAKASSECFTFAPCG